MNYGTPDRACCFAEGIREPVWQRWREQGMPDDFEEQDRFAFDPRQEISPDLEPHPVPRRLPVSGRDLEAFRRSLDPGDPTRLPDGWEGTVKPLGSGETVRMLRVHRGLFLSMGVNGWDMFGQLMDALVEKPAAVREAMDIQAAFCAAMAERVLADVDVDAAVFSEPIGGNDRPLISPRMYADIVLESYAPVLKVLHRHRVSAIVFRTYANARILLPRLLDAGFNCLWACEVNIDAMDYRSLRGEFGRELRLIGGIDLDAVRRGRKAIDRELKAKLPPLLAQGGYVPLADGRVREDVPFEHYRHYRRLLVELAHRAGSGAVL